MGVAKKVRTTHARRFALLALLFAAVTFIASGGFVDGYVPRCDNHAMNPGDSCIRNTGGGSYAEMVDRHYRDFHIMFWAALCVMIFFTYHSILEAVRGRRARKRSQP
ncbi:MAG TPA: hypothetical protein VFH76_34955 [Kribbella sp.]|nr:hypothetical protein [Kribbella sp.]